MKDLLELNVWICKFKTILEKAFYKIYPRTEHNWIKLECIRIWTDSSEELSEAPDIGLYFRFGHFDNQYDCVAAYEIEESEEYNCGVLRAIIENAFAGKGSNQDDGN